MAWAEETAGNVERKRGSGMTDIGTQIRDYTYHIVQEVNAEDVFDRTAKAALVKARSSRGERTK